MNNDVKPKGAMLLVCRGEKYAVWMMRADQRAITANGSVSCTIDDSEWRKIIGQSPNSYFPEDHSEWATSDMVRLSIDEWCEMALKFVAGHRMSIRLDRERKRAGMPAST